MSYSLLFILCEGNDDRQFLERIFAPLLDYDNVQYYQYAQRTSKDVRSMVQSIQSMDAEPSLDAEYLYFCDFDQSECITSKKREVTNRCHSLDPDRIFVVREAIESWYIAGVQEHERERLGISLPRRTDGILKAHFNNALPKREPRISVMREMLDVYDLRMARRRNYSLDYFCRKSL